MYFLIGWYIENVSDCFKVRFFHIIFKYQKTGRFRAGVDNYDSSFLTPVLEGGGVVKVFKDQ